MALGRPSSFTQEIADAICERLADGESLRKICLDEDMPNKATVFRWLAANASFRDQYAYAREEQGESHADEIVDIADNVGNPLVVDGIPVIGADGKPVMFVDAAAVNHARLRVDSRKWTASKLKPKKYGDKISQEISGADGAPFTVQIVSFSDANDPVAK